MAPAKEVLDISDSDFDGIADDVDGMVGQMVAENPHFSKWMVMSPSLMKQKEKQQKQKLKHAEKRTEKKRKTDENDSASDDNEKPKRKKKAKATEEDEEELIPIVLLTGYIHIMKPAPSLPPKSRNKPKPETLYLSRGPFNFMSNCNFDAFTSAMAAALPCNPAHLVLDKTTWKPQTPANRAPLPLGGDVGLKVLQKQIAVSRDRMVIMIMPGPRKPTEEAPFWDTNEAGGSANAEAGPLNTGGDHFDFRELEATSLEESVGEQKISFDKAVAPHIEELKERWPENDDGKRIDKDEKGFQWELTQIRLSIWAAHIARGTATLDKAPLSTQFDIKYRLKAPSVAAPLLSQPGPSSTPSSTDKILELLAMSMMMQQQQHHQPSYQPVPMALPPVLVTPSNHSPVPSVPPSPVKLAHCSVSLAEFCTYYNIAQHFEKLEKLEYEPGNGGILTLGRDDWQQVAGFSKLAWDKVLSKHKQFVKDVRAGVWA
ncbi:hypothetical protein K438DRAFT_2023594 [Mycena galopus ATCC 62051]|nr:hypothetical protein K438DRAFT_2023594 [Mycena galopus ATCC 62051]